MAKKMSPAKAEAPIVDAQLVRLPEADELQAQVWPAVKAFFHGLTAFVTTAGELERRARENVLNAKRLLPPTTADEDEDIQRWIKAIRADRQEVEQHWKITSLVSQFHRRLTAARARAVDANEDAANIAQRLHNDYVEAQKRKAREEAERDRLMREAIARQERERELERLEAEALAREAASETLSAREEVFVGACVAGISTASAAQRAGYKDPVKMGARLMETPKIAEAIQGRLAALALRKQAEATRQAPIEVAAPPVIRPDISRAAGATDRTTWSAEVLDEQALIDACCEGRHGIPRDILQVRRPKVNEYARSMHELIDRWPGVRHVKNTRTV